MAVLFRATGIPKEGYEQVVSQVGDKLVRAPGFVAHGAGPADGAYQVVELWESREDVERWLEEDIRPVLPPGMEPQFHFEELETVIR